MPMPDVGPWWLAFNVCDSKSGLTYTGVRFVCCTRHVYWLLADQLICLIMCTAQVFKISYPIHLVSLSVPTYSVTIKIKANYLLKYNFIATEIAETSLLKHFILSHDIAQSKHLWRHIINLFFSKNKHLETGTKTHFLFHIVATYHIHYACSCHCFLHTKSIMQPKKKKVYYVITQIKCLQ
jgi:hypothetical protein